MSFGQTLREARAARGLSIGDVSKATRIPEVHLQALEDDRPDALPEGPYRAAYTRAVCALLELEPPEDLPEVTLDPPVVPLWGVRIIAGLAVTSVLVSMGVVGWIRFGPPPADPDQVVVVPMDQKVTITAKQTTRLVAHVDGELTYNGRLAGGDSLDLEGHARIEVDVPAAERVRVEYNGRTVRPQGRQDAPRRLVFIDDVGPNP